jgi:hypothetical protein
MSLLYAESGCDIFGGPRGMRDGFDQMVRAASDKDDPSIAIVVSDESSDYRPEMGWLAEELCSLGRRVWMVRPDDINFTESGLFIQPNDEKIKLDVIYRFFELFDLKNIPKSELLSYAVKKKLVVMTPPYKHFLEEKMLLALLHHPMLEEYWVDSLGLDDFCLLKEVVPKTWILDSRPVPPHAVITDFRYQGRLVQNWKIIEQGTQKDRRLVIKPSGFSPLAWGSRGVVVGHDVSAEEWSKAVDNAVFNFSRLPYVLQHFHEGKRVLVRYYDPDPDVVRDMQGRVRLCPYYFALDQGVTLGNDAVYGDY